VPLQDWIGWWRDSPGTRDRLLITAGSSPGTLRVSGRAYWYGINRNVHYGQLNSRDATPSGPYLHLVESDTLSGCVVDLHFDPARHSLRSYDNSNCGGMNVHFSGTWTRFTLSPGRHKYFSPKTSINPHVKPPAAAKSS